MIYIYYFFPPIWLSSFCVFTGTKGGSKLHFTCVMQELVLKFSSMLGSIFLRVLQFIQGKVVKY